MLFLIVKFIEDTTSSIFAPNDAPVLDAFRCTVLLYRFTDVTGDDFVDAGDVSIVDNNAFNAVSVITP